MTNKEVSRYLRETADLIILTGGNQFRARAFANAARTIERIEEPVESLLDAGTLTDVRGIGKGLADQIEEIVRTGSFTLREELLGSIPPGIIEMLRVKGIGAKTARTIWKSLNVTSIEALEQAATIGRLAETPGFGEKTQENILKALQAYRRYRSARRYAVVYREAKPLVESLRELDGVTTAELSSDLRRKMETVTSASIIIGGEVDVVRRSLEEFLRLEADEKEDELLFTGTIADGLPLRILVVPTDRFGSELWRDTGSANHIEQFVAGFGEPAPTDNEATIFASAGLQFIPPELREGDGELDAASDGSLPQLIQVKDLKGSLHNHSNYSDGAHSLVEMAEAARSMGLSYFGICDHSRSLTVANGLSIERVREQQEEIRNLNETYRAEGQTFRIFSGIESDILQDGSLDYPDDVLASFDFVVSSIHSHFNMTRKEATARLVKAIENPYTSIVGHMTGRLLLTREGYPVDHNTVIDACAQNNVAIEINANPHRLDMDWRHVRKAVEKGVLISINPDAHSIAELEYHQWGVAVARKGWLTPDRCLNAMTLEQFSAWIDHRRSAA